MVETPTIDKRRNYALVNEIEYVSRKIDLDKFPTPFGMDFLLYN